MGQASGLCKQEEGIAAVVVEATYGVSNHLPREGREQRLLSRVRAILKGGGRCLLPVVALGRAQVPISAPPALPSDPCNQALLSHVCGTSSLQALLSHVESLEDEQAQRRRPVR